jgi:hypothetical protein
MVIGGSVVAPDVWREWHVSDPFDGVHEIGADVGPEPYDAPAVKVARDDLTAHPDAIAFEHHPGTGFELLTRMDQHFPLSRTPSSRIPKSQGPNSQAHNARTLATHRGILVEC